MSDELPQRPASRLTILPLDGLGVTELRDYAAALRTEITRVEATIAHKQDHRSAAESVFGKMKGAV